MFLKNVGNNEQLSIAENNKLMLNKGSTYEKNVTARIDIYLEKCGLYIPDGAINYNDFKLKIADSEQEFMQKVCMLSERLVNQGELSCH